MSKVEGIARAFEHRPRSRLLTFLVRWHPGVRGLYLEALERRYLRRKARG